MNKKTLLMLLGTSILFFGGIFLVWTIESRRLTARNIAPVKASPPAAAPTLERAKQQLPIPAFQSEVAASSLAPTLNPEMFNGSARAAYQIAREIPETLAQIPCYCHCDKSIGHKSLHSCFVDDHGSSCGICMNEAMTAYKLKKEKKLSDAEIRERIITEYGK